LLNRFQPNYGAEGKVVEINANQKGRISLSFSETKVTP
jgi:hypothetical protein